MRGIIILFLLCNFSGWTQELPSGSYDELKSGIATKRQEFNRLYLSDSTHRDTLIAFAKQYVFQKITNEIFKHWYGTPWEFYGQTEVPHQDAIACGYFVTTVLRDAGFNIPRVKWAQCASEVMIKRIAADIRRFHSAPIEDIEDYICHEGDGLYLAGLDNHVGFIVKKDDRILFVHSNYYQPEIGVMAEDINGWNPLSNSRYRVIGKLLSDEMMAKWIEGERIE